MNANELRNLTIADLYRLAAIARTSGDTFKLALVEAELRRRGVR